MKIENDWAGTTMIPETNEEIDILKRLWEVIPISVKGYAPHPGSAIFIKENESDNTIFISTGE